jgi:hypothetical protein
MSLENIYQASVHADFFDSTRNSIRSFIYKHRFLDHKIID